MRVSDAKVNNKLKETNQKLKYATVKYFLNPLRPKQLQLEKRQLEGTKDQQPKKIQKKKEIDEGLKDAISTQLKKDINGFFDNILPGQPQEKFMEEALYYRKLFKDDLKTYDEALLKYIAQQPYDKAYIDQLPDDFQLPGSETENHMTFRDLRSQMTPLAKNLARNEGLQSGGLVESDKYTNEARMMVEHNKLKQFVTLKAICGNDFNENELTTIVNDLAQQNNYDHYPNTLMNTYLEIRYILPNNDQKKTFDKIFFDHIMSFTEKKANKIKNTLHKPTDLRDHFFGKLLDVQKKEELMPILKDVIANHSKPEKFLMPILKLNEKKLNDHILKNDKIKKSLRTLKKLVPYLDELTEDNNIKDLLTGNNLIKNLNDKRKTELKNKVEKLIGNSFVAILNEINQLQDKVMTKEMRNDLKILYEKNEKNKLKNDFGVLFPVFPKIYTGSHKTRSKPEEELEKQLATLFTEFSKAYANYGELEEKPYAFLNERLHPFQIEKLPKSGEVPEDVNLRKVYIANLKNNINYADKDERIACINQLNLLVKLVSEQKKIDLSNDLSQIEQMFPPEDQKNMKILLEKIEKLL